MTHIDKTKLVLSTSMRTGELLDIMIALCEPAGVTVLINILEWHYGFVWRGFFW